METTYQRVKDWNIKCGKELHFFGSPAYWESIEQQIERIEEELEETKAAIAERNYVELLDGCCDLDVTVSGLAYLSGMEYEKAVSEVLDNNDLKHTPDIDEAIEALEFYDSKGLACDLYPVVSGNSQYYSVHRIKDGKIMKLLDHPRVDLSRLVCTG